MRTEIKPGLSIVFPFRNRDINRVINSLESLSNQIDKDFEIIFIDYGSDIEISKELQLYLSKYSNCRYFYSDTRGMPWNRSHALNTGVKLASKEYIFTSDIDLIFRNDFVKIFKENVTTGLATFFSVGYLKEGTEPKDRYGIKDYYQSKSFALGLLGIHRNSLMEIHGYDEFYSFWGMEDNDMEYRLKRVGIETCFYEKDVILFHQYHPPAHLSQDNIPNGWKVFQADYFNDSSDVFIRNQGIIWGKLFTEEARPALTLYWNKEIKFNEINCRSNYFDYYLCNFINEGFGNELKISVEDLTSNVHLESKLGRFVKGTSKKFSFLPFNIVSAYRDQFSTAYDQRDAFIYFIKSHKSLISDYFYEIIGHKLLLTIIKK